MQQKWSTGDFDHFDWVLALINLVIVVQEEMN